MESSVPAATNGSVDLAHAALLIIDMQEHFRPIAAGVVTELNATIGAFRAAGLPVVFTQHGHRNAQLDSGQLGW